MSQTILVPVKYLYNDSSRPLDAQADKALLPVTFYAPEELIKVCRIRLRPKGSTVKPDRISDIYIDPLSGEYWRCDVRGGNAQVASSHILSMALGGRDRGSAIMIHSDRQMCLENASEKARFRSYLGKHMLINVCQPFIDRDLNEVRSLFRVKPGSINEKVKQSLVDYVREGQYIETLSVEIYEPNWLLLDNHPKTSNKAT